MTTRTMTVYDGNGKVVGTETFEVADEQVNLDAIAAAARQALATNRTYVGIANPTAAQTTAAVKAIARQQNGIIRLLLGLLDATD